MVPFPMTLSDLERNIEYHEASRGLSATDEFSVQEGSEPPPCQLGVYAANSPIKVCGGAPERFLALFLLQTATRRGS